MEWAFIVVALAYGIYAVRGSNPDGWHTYGFGWLVIVVTLLLALVMAVIQITQGSPS